MMRTKERIWVNQAAYNASFFSDTWQSIHIKVAQHGPTRWITLYMQKIHTFCPRVWSNQIWLQSMCVLPLSTSVRF